MHIEIYEKFHMLVSYNLYEEIEGIYNEFIPASYFIGNCIGYLDQHLGNGTATIIHNRRCF